MTDQKFSPGLEGIIAADTKISYLDVDHEEIIIKGYDLIELAQKLSYPDVAYLLIHGIIPTKDKARDFCNKLSQQGELSIDLEKLLALFPKSMNLMDALRTGISFIASEEDPVLLNKTSIQANTDMGIRILSKAPSIAANAYHALNGGKFVHADLSMGYSENFLYMIQGKRPDGVSKEVFDRILTCYIEHEMPNSTFAARVIVSTLSDIYGAVVGAVASLKGPLHGGANEAAVNTILEIYEQGGVVGAEKVILDKLSKKERIMGFGHRVYMRKYDPRAFLLKKYIPKLVDRLPEGKDLYSIYLTIEKVMLREKGLYPNMDYPAGMLLYLLQVPIPLFTPIFLCSRIAGLIAHVIEQHENNRLYRPRVIYSGPRGLHPTVDKPISPI